MLTPSSWISLPLVNWPGFKPVALYQSIPLLCLSNGTMVLLYYFFPTKSPFKSPQLNSTTHGPTNNPKCCALKKYCDKLPQFNSKGIPPEPASMHLHATFPPQSPPACPVIRPYFLDGWYFAGLGPLDSHDQCQWLDVLIRYCVIGRGYIWSTERCFSWTS